MYPSRLTTMKPSPADDQSQARALYLGGHDVVALLGLHPYRTVWDVYLDKVDPKPSLPSMASQRGNLAEAIALELYKQNLPDQYALSSDPSSYTQHPQHAYMRGTPDAVVIKQLSRSTHKPMGLVSVKSCNDNSISHWLNGVPTHVAAQEHWYAALMRASGHVVDFVHVLCAHTGSDEIQQHEIAIDWDMCDRMVEVAHKFWTSHVVNRVPPHEWEPPSLEHMVRWQASIVLDETPAEANNTVIQLACRYAEITESLSSLDDERKRIATDLRKALGMHRSMEGGGVVVKLTKNNQLRVKVDSYTDEG